MKIISRKDAQALGLVRYYTGMPCKHGHIAERKVSDRKCIDCANLDSLKWVRANPEKAATKRAAWIKRNPDKHCEQYLKHGELYRRRNLDKVAAKVRRYQAAKLQRKPIWFGEFDALVEQEAYALARVRNAQTGIKWDVDHIIPLQGSLCSGLHCAENIQVIPATFNRSKGNTYEIS
nr:MAG TPA: HNH/ENDO VII superfamily nuclease [Caudoviricetes sp.]